MKKILRHIFPAGLWTKRFTAAWAGSFATVILFDLLWSMATSFRGLGFLQTYLYAAMLALLMALPALLSRRGRWLQGAVLVAADLLALANLMYGRTYFMPIPPASYLLAGNVAEFGDAITHSLRWADLLFPLVTVLTLRLMRPAPGNAASNSAYTTANPRTARLRLWGATFLAGAALCLATGAFSRMPLPHIEHLKGECYYRATPPVVYTLPVSILADLLESNRPVSDLEKTRAAEYLEEHSRLLASAADSLTYAGADTIPAAPTPRNLVFIIVESLEGWPLGAVVEGQEITPRLNRYLADTAHTFLARRVLSQVGPGRSIDGQLLMTSGLRPMADFVFSMRFPDSTYPHLARTLKADRGARSYLLSGDRATTWNQGAMARVFGFDETRFRDSWDSSESFGHPRNPSDGSFLRQVRELMEAGEIWPEGETAFLEVITYSSHFPFTIPAEHRRIELRGSYPEHLAEYITAINYTDNALGEFIDYILSRPDASETMIAIAGDHEALASWRDAIRSATPEAASLVEADSFIPLIVLNSPRAGVREDVMGQVDVYPTLLQLMGALPASADEGDASASSADRPTAAATPAERFPGLGFPAFSPLSPRFATDITGRLAGDTASVSPALLRQVLDAPAVSSSIIRADLLNPSSAPAFN